MSDETMRDVLARLEAQEKELAGLRAARPRGTTRPARGSGWLGRSRQRLAALSAAVLLAALVPLVALAANPFPDLSNPDRGHNADIDAIYNLGIVNGYPDGTYKPELPVTREQMATFIHRTAALHRIAFTSLPSAGMTENLGAEPEREYMNVQLTVPGRPGDATMFVKVSFTGYVFARSTTNGPSLLRGEIRLDDETAGAAQIVTRSVVGADPNAIVGAPATETMPGVAAAERLDFSGSRVFELAPGTYTFRMVVRREVGTAQDVGFGFGNMQAETIAFESTGARGRP